MIGRLKAYYKSGGIKGIIGHLNNFIRRGVTPLYMSFFEAIKKPENKVVFCNFAGKGYGGYPESICNELIRRGNCARLIWLVNGDYNLPERVEAVDINSYAAIRELATAKVWIDNCRKSQLIRKGKRQFYLQTWHGGGPCLKKIEGDALAYLSKSYIKDAINDTKMADLFISDCEWQNDVYRRAFWYNGEILNCTTPPNDFFYEDWKKIKADVYEKLNIDSGKHIVLYAPTFRNAHEVNCYDLEFKVVSRELQKKFGGEWVFVVRIHPTMAEKQLEIEYDDVVINGTTYPQIEELLIASDVLITDFSASMFLAYRWGITTFLYANDLEYYTNNERPLYFEIDSLPASFSSSNAELLQEINNFSKVEYIKRCQDFSKTVGFFEGGHSVQTITDRIEKEMA